ncbi:hypothetical protein GYMLUDRAFT_175315 [Collybiopsis luxurians FD-317 M1]|uniref:Uncharacterized protein n=1 Tax=Collybiopsis luxurians FD-317 M1 TaxID=944289 RepID=A0A0D0CKC9_9AGAR|nr:hypothetical protein GYMLUDRAFT_175315 [Collybiopsis luxurians FD-317 M1]
MTSNLVLTGLCVEWCKVRARAQQSQEELILVDEEMCHTIDFTFHQAEQWVKQKNQQENIPDTLRDGLRAYCEEQCSVE